MELASCHTSEPSSSKISAALSPQCNTQRRVCNGCLNSEPSEIANRIKRPKAPFIKRKFNWVIHNKQIQGNRNYNDKSLQNNYFPPDLIQK